MNAISRRTVLRGAGALADAATLNAQWWTPAARPPRAGRLAPPSTPSPSTLVLYTADHRGC
ncbi:hypothetical protein [Streptomyces phaeochromogenes]|uniref:hypothetical protein n=1 Tax=Streptomyces phaeochromogenes TaxID=1923 RepID=UPI002DDB56B4|nr:hypothetical protein [Streptomyces phaeochromogenes]WRZ34666.1 hypothetical protein OG931_46505 [Streptomyces phaeochromogenes]